MLDREYLLKGDPVQVYDVTRGAHTHICGIPTAQEIPEIRLVDKRDFVALQNAFESLKETYGKTVKRETKLTQVMRQIADEPNNEDFYLNHLAQDCLKDLEGMR